MTSSQIAKIYTIYYPLWIYDLINNQKCTYEWLNICDYKFINASGRDEQDFNLKGNPFITDAIKKNKKELGLDILKNGMYFPFFCIESENK